MNLRTDDFLVKLYNEVYDKLPTNVCSFFWGTFYIMLNFLTTIFGIIQLGVSYYHHNKDKSNPITAIIGITYLERFLQFMFILLFYTNTFTTNYMIVDYIIFISLIVLTVFLVYFLISFVEFIFDNTGNYLSNPKKEKKRKQPGLIKTYFKSIKEKYCELITYTN